jgi:hypothetical protein
VASSRCAAAALVAVLWASAARAQTPDPADSPRPITAGADVEVTSDYVWHGFLVNPTASVQPNLWLKIGSLTISSWMNASRVGPRGQSLTEHDLTIDLTREAGPWTISAGWTNYAFVDLAEGRYSNELYVGATHDSYVQPTVQVSADVHQGSGTYLSVGASHDYALWREDVTLSPRLTVGYNHYQWIAVSSMSDAALGLELSVPMMNGRVILAPSVTYSRSLNAELFEHRTYAGVRVSVTGF